MSLLTDIGARLNLLRAQVPYVSGPAIARGINAGFGEPLPPEVLTALGRWKADVVRTGFAKPTGNSSSAGGTFTTAATITQQFVGQPFQPLLILTPEDDARGCVRAALANLGEGFTLEAGNEMAFGYTAERYATWLGTLLDQVRSTGFQGKVWYGCLPNLDQSRLDWLSDVQHRLPGICVDTRLGVSFHRYAPIFFGHQEIDMPHRGFYTREDEWRAFRSLVGSSDVACTEYGYDAGVRTNYFGRVQMSQPDRASAAHRELQRYTAWGVKLACWYQLNDGSDDQPISRYGLQNSNGLINAVFN